MCFDNIFFYWIVEYIYVYWHILISLHLSTPFCFLDLANIWSRDLHPFLNIDLWTVSICRCLVKYVLLFYFLNLLLAVAEFVESDSPWKTWYLLQLALKDADKVTNIQSSSVKSYITKACALMLVCTELFFYLYIHSNMFFTLLTYVDCFFSCSLERYEAARDTILSGLQIDPFR